MSTEAHAPERRVYGTLDGMRGVAAIAVVVLHGPALFGVLHAPSAGMAVDLFFVMSGFIIGHAYEAKLRAGMSAGRFILIRLIRLYPLYLLGLGLGVMEALAELTLGRSQAWTPGGLATTVFAGLFMLPGPPPGETLAVPAFRLNPPGWSLFFEILINIAYGLFLPRLSNRVMILLVAISGVALLAVALRFGDLAVGAYWDTFPLGIARVTYSFFVGVLIYRYRQRLKLPSVPPLLVLAICAAIFATASGKAAAWFEPIAVLGALPLLVIAGASTEPSRRLAPTFAFLGATSYAVYSLHYPILLASQGVLRRLLGDDFSARVVPWGGLVFLALLLFGAWLVDRLYDFPLRRRLTKMIARPTPPLRVGA